MRRPASFHPALVALLGLALLAGPALADDLDIGDEAPELAVSEWLRGEPVDPSSGERIVVVAWWATWCGPSLRAIPKLTEVHGEYAGRGVTVVGITTPDPNNSPDKIKEYIEKNATKISYRVAIDDTDRSWKAWMFAAGQKALSTVFVVDREGRIAWIGPPGAGLDRILGDILEGRYTAEKARRAKDLRQRIDDASSDGRWEEVLEAATELVELHAGWGHTFRYRALERLGRAEDARAEATEATEKAGEEVEILVELVGFLAGSEDGALRDQALAAIDRILEIEPESTEWPRKKFELLFAWGETRRASRAGTLVIQSLANDATALNNWAWALLTEDPYKGSFNSLALLAGAKAWEVCGQSEYFIADTYALALFETGSIQEAIDVEKKAIEMARKKGVPPEGLAELEKALARFEEALR